MRNVIFLVFVLFSGNCSSQHKLNKVKIKPYVDTLYYIQNLHHQNYFPRVEKKKLNYFDSTYRKYIFIPAKHPIQFEKNDSTNHSSPTLINVPIKTLIGIFERNDFSDYTFFTPAEQLRHKSYWELPISTFYYQNPSSVQVNFDQFQLTTNSLSTKDINDYLQPFLFLNKEVSNLMYQKFVHYVQDSLAREILAENLNILDWKTPTFNLDGSPKDTSDWILNYTNNVVWEKYAGNVQFQFLAQLYHGFENNRRFFSLLEIDTKKLNYQYTKENGGTEQLNIYPDTTCWIQQFSNSTLEPMTNMYFWHPAYDNYPVVGISWLQAKAYSHWLTKETNKILRKEKFPYRLTFDLPSIIQWDYVRNELRRENNALVNEKFNWETNLTLTLQQSLPLGTKQDSTFSNEDFEAQEGMLMRKNLLGFTLNNMGSNNSHSFNKNFLIAWYEIPEKTKGNHITNVGAMGTGVSEWLQESYQDNWKLMYYKRMELLIKSSGADTDIQALREEYFNAYNHPEGRMVIGANWYDYRDEYYEGKTFESMDAKVFADPNKGFATVGFRLIATFEPIED